MLFKKPSFLLSVIPLLSIFAASIAYGQAPTPLELKVAQLERQVSRLTSVVKAQQRLLSTFSMVTVNGSPTLRVTGVNFQVVNGTGITASKNGTGNILIGYDEPNTIDTEQHCSIGTNPVTGDAIFTQTACTAAGGIYSSSHKDGSHYLIVGTQNNYSRWGGIVAGFNNTATYDFASVTGGSFNQAYGQGTQITAGFDNTAVGPLSVINGGARNISTGGSSSISGGIFNETVGGISSVIGGENNGAVGNGSAVIGGFFNFAFGTQSVIVGGQSNTTDGQGATIAGGVINRADGTFAAVAGGQGNRAIGGASAVGGGSGNDALNLFSTVSGGRTRTASGEFDWVAGSIFQDE